MIQVFYCDLAQENEQKKEPAPVDLGINDDEAEKVSKLYSLS